MRLGAVPEPALRARFRTAGVRLRLAGLCINIRTDIPAVIAHVLDMYVGHELETGAGIDDFRIRLSYTGPFRRFVRRKTQIFIDGDVFIEPLPLRLAPLALEAALNACINSIATKLVLHAAVVERDGLAVILPAPSGSGKSTLCAALVMRGWRLLSDEHAVLRPADGRLQPVARSISLKNESIPLIRAWASDPHFSAIFHDTIDGTVAFLRPPADAVARIPETAAPALIVSPAWQADVPVTLEPLGKSETFRRLADDSMNYHTTQRLGFDTLVGLVDSCAAYRLWYGPLAQGVEAMEALVARTRTERAANRPATTTV
jgi:HprK-related kinase A